MCGSAHPERLLAQTVQEVGGVGWGPPDGSAEATRLGPNHAAQHAAPRPVSQSVRCMQSSDTPAAVSPVGPAGATGRGQGAGVGGQGWGLGGGVFSALAVAPHSFTAAAARWHRSWSET